MSKRRLRAAARERRVDRSTAERAQEALLREPALGTANTIALYAAVDHEPPLDRVAQVLLARGATLLFPVVEAGTLRLGRVQRIAELVPGYREILEPPPSAPRFEPEQVDVFVVPGVLFDRSGRRLGRGRGHYDRLLKRARSDSLGFGFAFDERVVDALPEDEWDVRMHFVVTATQRIRGRG